MAQDHGESLKNEPGKFIKFLTWGVIPSFFTIAVAVIVLQVLGFDLKEKIEPAAEALAWGEEEEAADMSATVDALEKELAEKSEAAESAEQELLALQDENAELLDRQDQLTVEIEALKSANEEKAASLREIAALYEAMSPKSAAPVLAEMNEAAALKILAELPAELTASIFEEMEPAKAASFTEKMGGFAGG